MSDNPSDLHRLFVETSMNGDVESFMTVFAEDAVMMPPNDTSLFGKPEIRAWIDEYLQHFRVTSSVETEHQLTIAGDLAFDRRSVSVTIVPKQRGARIRDDVRSLTVSKNESGTWRVTQFIWNSVKPVGAGTNRFMTRMLEKKPRQSSTT